MASQYSSLAFSNLHAAMDLINVTHDGRTLQMRPDQLTITVLSKAFRLIPEMIFSVSDRGTIAVAEDIHVRTRNWKQCTLLIECYATESG